MNETVTIGNADVSFSSEVRSWVESKHSRLAGRPEIVEELREGMMASSADLKVEMTEAGRRVMARPESMIAPFFSLGTLSHAPESMLS